MPGVGTSTALQHMANSPYASYAVPAGAYALAFRCPCMPCVACTASVSVAVPPNCIAPSPTHPIRRGFSAATFSSRHAVQRSIQLEQHYERSAAAQRSRSVPALARLRGPVDRVPLSLHALRRLYGLSVSSCPAELHRS
jgi:hypothetical protein